MMVEFMTAIAHPLCQVAKTLLTFFDAHLTMVAVIFAGIWRDLKTVEVVIAIDTGVTEGRLTDLALSVIFPAHKLLSVTNGLPTKTTAVRHYLFSMAVHHVLI